MNTAIIYKGEVRTETNGSISALSLSDLINNIAAVELTLHESIVLEDALADGDAVPYLGYAFQKQVRRGADVYNAFAIKRRRK